MTSELPDFRGIPHVKFEWHGNADSLVFYRGWQFVALDCDQVMYDQMTESGIANPDDEEIFNAYARQHLTDWLDLLIAAREDDRRKEWLATGHKVPLTEEIFDLLEDLKNCEVQLDLLSSNQKDAIEEMLRLNDVFQVEVDCTDSCVSFHARKEFEGFIDRILDKTF